MSSVSNERFNAEALSWDSNPDVHRFTDGALAVILAVHPALAGAKATGRPAPIDVLEIGCGTGLLSLGMAPYVRSLVAVDAADGMIDALKTKLSKLSPGEPGSNVRPLCIMLTNPEDVALPEGKDRKRKKFDLITSHLVLHHIPDLVTLLQTMHGCLKLGGEILLTDFEDFGPEARKFHPEAKMAGVERHGVNAKEFAGLTKEAGFADVDVRAAWTMDKEVERFPGEWGQSKPKGDRITLETMEFPFLLCRGRRIT